MSTEQLQLTEINDTTDKENSPSRVFIVYGSSRWDIIDRFEGLFDRCEYFEENVDNQEFANQLVNEYDTLSRTSAGYMIYHIDRSKIFNNILKVVDEVDIIYISNFDQLGMNTRVLLDRIEAILSHGTSLYLVDAQSVIHPESTVSHVLLSLLRMLDRASVEIQREAAVQDLRKWMDDISHDGRPPLGFHVEDGELRPDDNFDEVRSVLTLVESGELSNRKAADRLGCSPRTITRALDRPEMYGLD